MAIDTSDSTSLADKLYKLKNLRSLGIIKVGTLFEGLKGSRENKITN